MAADRTLPDLAGVLLQQQVSAHHMSIAWFSSLLHMGLADCRMPGCTWEMRAAMALCPRSRPSTMPAAMASTFFRAPQISTPTTSVVVFTRMAVLANRPCIVCARSMSCTQPHIELQAQLSAHSGHAGCSSCLDQGRATT